MCKEEVINYTFLAAIDAQEEDLPPCEAAVKKRPIAEEKSTDAVVAIDSDEGDATCLPSIPKDDEFWVRFRKRQQFYQQQELKRDGRWL
jgi:hypothetical protein